MEAKWRRIKEKKDPNKCEMGGRGRWRSRAKKEGIRIPSPTY